MRDHVRKMGQYAFHDLGEQQVKNIAQPIRAFWVRSAVGEAAAQAVDTPPIDPKQADTQPD